MPVPCLHAGLSLEQLWKCATPRHVVGLSVVESWFVVVMGCVVCVSPVDRAFEPVEGSNLVWLFRSWVRPAVAVTLTVTRSFAF